SLIWKTKDLRNKILIVLGLLLLTRVLAHIPIAGIDVTGLKNYLAQNQFFSLLDVFSGGGLTNFSIAMLGVGPYITASIIMQLLTIVIPSFAEMQKEGGEAGRAQINQYTRYLAIMLAPLQGFGTIRLLQSQGGSAVLGTFSPFQWFIVLLSITTGTMLLMWIGEIMSEFDIGNGVSLIIFAGIVARLPQAISGGYNILNTRPDALQVGLGFIAVTLVVIFGVVLVTEAQRNVPIAYAKRVRGDKLLGGVDTHLPLRLNQAGVIPIIFAISLMIFPPMVAQFFVHAKSAALANFAQKVVTLFSAQGWFYGVTYFILIMAFTYFYTAVVFNPEEIAENVQKNGGFVPGLRPGQQTANFLSMVLNRITLAGAFFLAVIAILPLLLQKYTGTTSLTFGGTSLLIVVSVVIEIVKKVEAQMTMHDYEGF
ncbi:MAG TPA: preprotein translocase subunit SecY, partial [Candidatus Limnocylindria bacterium]|nr:preprotein translocase subunit SecY [Candidatus Limnocylindria bacterium]